MEGFDKFCKNRNYVALKNSLFNYLNRKNQIKNICKRFDINGLNALDLGSGISPVSPFAEKTLFMDVSEESLKYLKSKRLRTKYGSITNIPLEDETIEVLFCSEVLEHIGDYKKAIEEMARVLKKKGKAIITIPVYEKYWDFDDRFVGHYRRFEPNEFERNLKEKGLRIMKKKAIGSKFERELTKLIVKIFKNQRENFKVSKIKVFLSRALNQFLYLLVKISVAFNSVKSTSIMLYVCEKE